MDAVRRVAIAVSLTLAIVCSAAAAGVHPVEDPADHATYDPFFGEQWALRAIHAPQAWAVSTGAGVRIGVVDTGVDLGHEDLAAKVVASVGCIGANSVEAACQGTAQDDEGHGTHVSGLAAAVTANGKGVAALKKAIPKVRINR